MPIARPPTILTLHVSSDSIHPPPSSYVLLPIHLYTLHLALASTSVSFFLSKDTGSTPARLRTIRAQW